MTQQKLQKHLNDEFAENIKDLYGHARIANEEMGKIKTDIAIIKTEFKDFRVDTERALSSLNAKQWAIILGILTIALAVIFNVHI